MASQSALREVVDPPGLVVAGLAGLATWAVHAPGLVAIACGLTVLAVKVGAGLLLRPKPSVVSNASPDRGPLTRREWEICLLLPQGMTNKEIATRLFISEASVDSHLAHAREKLDFHSRAEISRWVTERQR